MMLEHTCWRCEEVPAEWPDPCDACRKEIDELIAETRAALTAGDNA